MRIVDPDITGFYALPPDLIKKEYHFFFSTRRIRASDRRVRVHGNPDAGVVPVVGTDAVLDCEGTRSTPGVVVTIATLSGIKPVDLFPVVSATGTVTSELGGVREKPYTFERSTATIRVPSPLTATDRDFMGLFVV